MSDPRDYDYYAHSGNHFMVTHENGRPRFQPVTNRQQQFNSSVNANAHVNSTDTDPANLLGSGLANRAAQAIRKSKSATDAAIAAGGG
jgi:phosphoglycerol transferase MdoB-like AlkP superfamily enzyme